MIPARPLIVVAGLTLGALPNGQLVVDDSGSGQRLGDAIATLTPFPVNDGVVLAGQQERPDHRITLIVTPTNTGMEYPVKNGAWMTEPIPYEAGPITMIAKDRDGRELFRVEARPDVDGFRPVFGPDWVGYVPTAD
jgi:hypothetical protein